MKKTSEERNRGTGPMEGCSGRDKGGFVEQPTFDGYRLFGPCSNVQGGRIVVLQNETDEPCQH